MYLKYYDQLPKIYQRQRSSKELAKGLHRFLEISPSLCIQSTQYLRKVLTQTNGVAQGDVAFLQGDPILPKKHVTSLFPVIG